jgi:DNA-directed RNA polymerase specialized sigma24 family protein
MYASAMSEQPSDPTARPYARTPSRHSESLRARRTLLRKRSRQLIKALRIAGFSDEDVSLALDISLSAVKSWDDLPD